MSHPHLTRSQMGHLPMNSWWVGLDRETFYAVVQREGQRIRLSYFGHITTLATGADVAPPKTSPRDLEETRL